jgi:hypothetical protein
MADPVTDGNVLFAEIPLKPSGEVLSLSYWDLWFLMILVKQFAGDWNALAEHFRQNKTSSETTDGCINHARELHHKLESAGIPPQSILTDAPPDLLRAQSARARRKVRDQQFADSEMSIWMIETPRWQFENRAMRGFWSFFPVSPLAFAGEIEKQFKPKGYYTEDQSLRLSHKLNTFLDRHADRLSLPELFALDRAFLTVMIEKIELIDDSYGVIGDLYEDVFLEYAQLDRSALDMPSEVFLEDLLTLMIRDDYGFTDDSLPEFFANLDAHEVPMVETILEKKWKELGELGLDSQAEDALAKLGLLYTQQKMFDRFVPIASVMRARAWERITRMAEMAENQNHPELALAVYEACGAGPVSEQGESAGSNEKFLRKKYEKIKDRLRTLGFKYP